VGRLREVKDSLRAMLSLRCMRVGSSRASFKGVEDRQILRAHIKRDEVSSPVVPWATSNGDGYCMCGNPEWGKVVRAGPCDGGLPETEYLVYLRLLE
jgi:hypothetical protein